MKGKLLITSCILLACLNANAQLKFQKAIGGAILDWANSVEQTPDSNFIVLGSTRNFGAGMEDMFLIKINPFGDTLWTRTFGGSNDEEGGYVRMTTDGGFMLAGTTKSFGAGSSDIYVVKTDNAGNVQWSKTYGGPTIEFCNGMQQCADNGYIISGYSNSIGAGAADALLIKTDAAGDVEWHRSIGNNVAGEGFSGIQTSDGGYAMTGYLNVGGNLEAIMAKTDAAGTFSWIKTYGGASYDEGQSLVQTSDGGYCIAGITSSFGTGDTNMYVVRTNSVGDTVWCRTYGGSATEKAYSIRQTSDNGFIITGGTTSFGIGGYDVLIIKTDANGQEEWTRTIGGFSNARDEGRAVSVALDGGYIVAGYTQSFGAGGGTDIFLVKTDSAGESGCNHVALSITPQSVISTQATVTLTVDSGLTSNTITTPLGYGAGVVNIICTTVGVNQVLYDNNTLTIYPNPFTHSAIVNIDHTSNSKEIQFILYDVHGREVRHQLINTIDRSGEQSFSFNLSRGTLEAGMYFYNLVGDGRTLGTGKLVIE